LFAFIKTTELTTLRMRCKKMCPMIVYTSLDEKKSFVTLIVSALHEEENAPALEFPRFM